MEYCSQEAFNNIERMTKWFWGYFIGFFSHWDLIYIQNHLAQVWLRFYEWLDSLGKRRISAFIIEQGFTPHPQHLCIFIGSAKFFGSVAVSAPCECVSHTSAVACTQTHHLCVTSASIDRQPLCWFQICHRLTLSSQALGLYSPCFCLGLSLPLSLYRAQPTIDGEALSFLIFTASSRFLSLQTDRFILL